jgi:hypothetical protein
VRSETCILPLSLYLLTHVTCFPSPQTLLDDIVITPLTLSLFHIWRFPRNANPLPVTLFWRTGIYSFIKSQVCYEQRITLDTKLKCLSPPGRSELLVVGASHLRLWRNTSELFAGDQALLFLHMTLHTTANQLVGRAEFAAA